MTISNWQWTFDSTAGEFLELSLFEGELPVQIIKQAVVRYPQYTKYELQRELSETILFHKKRDLCEAKGHNLLGGVHAVTGFQRCSKCGAWQPDKQLI